MSTSGNADGSETAELKQLKAKLFEYAATTSRGQLQTPSESESILEIINELEALNPVFSAPPERFSIMGTWQLVYTDCQLFQSSPFFMALRELFGSNSDEAKRIFGLHRAAASTGEIGTVKQIISKNELISKVDLRVGKGPPPLFGADS